MELTMQQMVEYYMEVYGVSEQRAKDMIQAEYVGHTIEETDED